MAYAEANAFSFFKGLYTVSLCISNRNINLSVFVRKEENNLPRIHDTNPTFPPSFSPGMWKLVFKKLTICYLNNSAFSQSHLQVFERVEVRSQLSPSTGLPDGAPSFVHSCCNDQMPRNKQIKNFPALIKLLSETKGIFRG